MKEKHVCSEINLMSGQKANPSPPGTLPVYKIPFPPGAELSCVPGVKMRENLVPPSGPVISLNLWELFVRNPGRGQLFHC